MSALFGDSLRDHHSPDEIAKDDGKSASTIGDGILQSVKPQEAIPGADGSGKGRAVLRALRQACAKPQGTGIRLGPEQRNLSEPRIPRQLLCLCASSGPSVSAYVLSSLSWA